MDSTDATDGLTGVVLRPAVPEDLDAVVQVLLRARYAAVPAMPAPVHPDESATPFMRGRMAEAETWVADDGVKAASFKNDKRTLTLTIDKKAAPEFGEYLMSMLPEIYASFKRTKE